MAAFVRFLLSRVSFLVSVGVLAIFTLSLVVSAQAQTSPLFPVTNFANPFGIAWPFVAGDFNGDGTSDLAFLSGNGTTSQYPSVTILLGYASSSTPTPVVSSLLSCTPYSLLAADMNNDKKLDLVLTCSASVLAQGSYVVVMLGNGDGTFQTPAYYAVSGLASVTATDLNGDGYLDIAAASASGVSVLLNKGSSAPGTLSAPVSYAIQPGQISCPIASGDFNGDGKQDVIVCENSPNGPSLLAVLYGNGDGTLQAPQTTSGGGTSLLAADLNGDGITDIAYIYQNTSPETGYSLNVLLGSTSGSFATGASISLRGAYYYDSPIPFTDPETGRLDLAMVGDATTILLGDGGGGFSVGASYPFSGEAAPEPLANGRTNLLYLLDDNFTTLVGNGDGTFQGIPTLPYNTYNGVTSAVAADVNGDGLTDVVSLDGAGNLQAALARGDGTFTPITPTQGASGQSSLITGDFNGDGKVDALTLMPQQTFYAGNGDGTFQPGISSNVLQLGSREYVYDPQAADFNGDGKLDLAVSTVDFLGNATSLEILLGNGDGSFAPPVQIGQLAGTGGASGGVILAADLNNDNKIDLIWNGSVFLGNGDGTFKQIPLGLPSSLVYAVGDLNGDGIPDVVTQNVSVGTSVNVYAGNGDGTFQTSPFYTASLPAGDSPNSISIGDVNADGYSDLAVQCGFELVVFLGGPSGAFTADSNTYYIGAGSSGNGIGGTSVLAHLNNSAPAGSMDKALDYLAFSDGATVLLNQLNPAPTAPAPLASRVSLVSSAATGTVGQQLTLTATVTGASPTGTITLVAGSTTLGSFPVANGVATLPISFSTAGTYTVTANYSGDSNNQASTSSGVSIGIAAVPSTVALTASAANANEKQSITLTAMVSGDNPSGNVAFTAGSTALGSAPLSNGVATLQYAFPAAGSYSVIAAYSGDTNNVASSSNTVAITVVAPDFTIGASPASATISPGQSATTTLTITPVGGYSGTVQLACGTLPSEVSCTFSPSSVSIAGSPVTSTLTISTTAATASIRDITGSLSKIAWAGLLGFLLSYRRIRNANRKLMTTAIAAVVLFSVFVFLTACGGGSHSTTTTNPGTPAGADTLTVTLIDSTSGISHTVPFQLTIQ